LQVIVTRTLFLHFFLIICLDLMCCLRPRCILCIYRLCVRIKHQQWNLMDLINITVLFSDYLLQMTHILFIYMYFIIIMHFEHMQALAITISSLIWTVRWSSAWMLCKVPNLHLCIHHALIYLPHTNALMFFRLDEDRVQYGRTK
jgi:hypothetical protein